MYEASMRAKAASPRVHLLSRAPPAASWQCYGARRDFRNHAETIEVVDLNWDPSVFLC